MRGVPAMPDAAAMRICRHGCGAVGEPGSCHGNRTWVAPASSPLRARHAGLACAISLRFHAALSSVNEFRHGLLRSSRVQRDGCATSASDACTRSDARRGRCAAREWMQRGVGTVMRATTQAEMPIAHENVVFLRGGRFVVAPHCHERTGHRLIVDDAPFAQAPVPDRIAPARVQNPFPFPPAARDAADIGTSNESRGFQVCHQTRRIA